MAHSGKTMTFATDLVPQENSIYNLGSSSKKWKIYADTIEADNITNYVKGNGSIFYGTCDTAAGTLEKEAVVQNGFTTNELVPGAIVLIKFSVTEGSSTSTGGLTLDVNGTGAKPIKFLYNGAYTNLPARNYLKADQVYQFIYDGTNWIIQLMQNSNTHYTTHMYVNATAGGATSNANTANTTTYLHLYDNTTKRETIQIKGSGTTSVSSTDGVITINSATPDLSSTYLKLNGSNNMTADVNIITGDTDKFINFWYDTNKKAGASWRIGMLGSGSSNTNYFVLQSGTSTTSATTWNNALKIGQNNYDIYNNENRIPNTGNTTGSVGDTTTPVYVDAGVIKTGTATVAIAANDTSSTGTFPVTYAATNTSTSTAKNDTLKKSTGKLYFQPSTGTLTATKFSGSLTGDVTGNVSGSSSSCTGNAVTATTATNLSAKPSLASSGNNITVTAGGKTSDAFTVPYATTASKLSNTSAIGATDRPVYFTSNGVPAQTTYRMAGTNATATTGITYSGDLDTGIWYVSSIATADNPVNNVTDGVIYANKYDSSWIHEIYGDYRTGQIAVRGKKNGTWQAWRKILDSSNYTDYAVAKTAGVTAVTWDSTNKKLTRTINGTTADVVTAATLRTDLELSNALHFIGITSTTLADGSTTSTLTAKSTGSLTKTTGFVDGDVVMDGDQLREYVWSGNAWRLLGITTSSAYSKTTSGNTFISSISQGTDGKVTADSRELDTSGTWSGTATKATTTADTSNTLYVVGVTSSATTTLKRDTSVTVKGGAVSATTYNGLTLTAASTGFTIAGGTTSKTLTVSDTITLRTGSASYLTYYSAAGTIIGHSLAHFADEFGSSVANKKNELVLGNATAKTSNGSAYGQLALYSPGTKGTYLNSAENSTTWYTATLQAKDGTIALMSDVIESKVEIIRLA